MSSETSQLCGLCSLQYLLFLYYTLHLKTDAIWLHELILVKACYTTGCLYLWSGLQLASHTPLRSKLYKWLFNKFLTCWRIAQQLYGDLQRNWVLVLYVEVMLDFSSFKAVLQLVLYFVEYVLDLSANLFIVCHIYWGKPCTV